MRRLHSPAAVVLLCAAAGCSSSNGGGGDSCKGNFLPGDLVITEIFADPPGDDSGKEWFEIYNAGSGPADLTGLTLVSSKNDKTGEKTHAMKAVTLGEGDYLVAGGVADDLKPAHVDYGYGSELGALRNTDGRLALRCGMIIVDETTYKTAPSAASTGFSGALVPDAVGNDDETMWCAAKTEFEAGSKGSPGAMNEACKSVGQPTDCVDNGTTRPIVAPVAGDLVISEWMANPKAVADASGEWFEVAVLKDVDLNGLQLGTVPPSVKTTVNDDARKCLRKTAGSFVLFARGNMAAMNGMLPAVDQVFDFGLTNSGGSIFIGIGGTVLDTVTYATSGDGVSSAVDPRKLNPTDNDDPASFCAGTGTIAGGDKGSPGAANAQCGMTTTEGKCNDGGTMRDIVAPAVGDLIITEVMANPAKVTDALGEWFEVFVNKAVDLNGLQIGPDSATVRTTLNATDCLKAAQGTYLVFGRNDDMTMNGGLPSVNYTFGFDLVNGGGSVALMRGGALLDLATYPTTPSAGGVAASLPPSKQNTTANDMAASFCNAVDTYGTGDKGTPGKVNPSCP